MKITVYFSAAEAKPGVLAKASVIYGDVLRLGTTVATFLYHGAEAVSVHPEPASAKKAFAKLKRGVGFLAGERDGEKIPGFHLGGSPQESSREKLKGRTVCFSSPSAAALLKCAEGVEQFYLGGFVNLGAVYESALRLGRDIVVIAAGSEGKPCLVDTVFAGLVADFLQNTVAGHPIELAESAKRAAAEAKNWQDRLVELMKESPEGKELIRVGSEKDMDFAAKLSRFSVAPVLKNGFFVRDVPPKMSSRPFGETPAPAPIKVQVPLFPKNPEHPTPGATPKIGAASPAKPVPGTTGKSSTPQALDAGKKKTVALGAKPPGKRAAIFSKKTVASLQVKAEVHHGHGHEIATEALKVALSKLDAKHAAKAGLKSGLKKASPGKAPVAKALPAKGGPPKPTAKVKKPVAKKTTPVKSKAKPNAKSATSRGKK